MDDAIPRTGSSLAEIINEQQKANISCEESQTLLNYYVSTLQSNLRASSSAQAGASCSDTKTADIFYQDGQLSNTGDVSLSFSDVARRRPRYQTSLETIQEVNSSLYPHSHPKNVTFTTNSAVSPKSAEVRKRNNETKKLRTMNTRSVRNCIETIFHKPIWTQEDENDTFGSENLYNQQKMVVSHRPSNCPTDASVSLPNYKHLLSKISSIDKTTQNDGEIDVRFPCEIKTDDDGAILIAPKVSLVNIHKDQGYSVSSEDLTSLQATTVINNRSILENQVPHKRQNTGLSQWPHIAEKVVDMSKHSRRQDADKHISMVEEKQRVAKELFERLRSFDNSSIQNIALNSLMLLEVSMKRCTLLRKSSTFEPEEVISSTTLMLNELTNLITVTGNQVRQVERLSTGDSDNLPILPLLTGPRSISSIFNSTETLMSPVRFSTSSMESSSMDNLFLKADTMLAEKQNGSLSEVEPPNKVQQANSSSSGSQLESVKLGDLICFDDIQKLPAYTCSTSSEITDNFAANLMDARLEDLPLCQVDKNKKKCADIAGKMYDTWEEYGGNSSTRGETPKEIVTLHNDKRFEDENRSRTKISSESFPIKETKNNISEVMEAERDMSDLKLHFKTIKLSKKDIEIKVDNNLARLKVNENNLINDYYLTKEIKDNDRSAFVKEEKSNLDRPQVDRSTNLDHHVTHKHIGTTYANESSNAAEHLVLNKQRYQTDQKLNKIVKSNISRNKSANTKKNEFSSLLTTETVKRPKTTSFMRDMKLSNKSVEKNLSNICERINVLKSCVATDNVSSNRSGNVKKKKNEKVSEVKNNIAGSKQFTNRIQARKTATITKTIEENICNKNTGIAVRNSFQDKSVCQNKATGNVRNKPKPQILTPPPWVTTRPPTEGSSKTYRSSKPITKDKSKQETENTKRSPNPSRDRKKSPNHDIKKGKENQRTFVSPSPQARNVNIYSCSRIVGTPRVLSTGGSKSRNISRRSRKMLTHQEVQDWVNYSRHQSPPKRGGQRRKQSASPPGRTRSERDVEHHRSFGARSTQPSIDHSHHSETQFSDLGFVHSSPCIQQTTSQIILDALKGTVDLGIHASISRAIPNRAAALSVTATVAKKIVESLSGSDEEETSNHSSDVNLTINQLVKSLDNTIESRSDKRVCWDSSIDSPPRSRSVPDETRTKLVETGSRVLQTLTHRLMGKLYNKRSGSGCLDDPETEVGRSQLKISQSRNESTAGICGTGSTRSRQRIRGTGSRGSTASVHSEKIEALVESLQFTSDGCLETRLNARDVEVQASHAMAALDDLQALLSGLKGNISGQPRHRTRNLMTPLPPPLNVKEDSPDSPTSELEATIETRGEATIITTSRPPCRNQSVADYAEVSFTPSKSPFTGKASKQSLGQHLLYGKFSSKKSMARKPSFSDNKWLQRNSEATLPPLKMRRATNNTSGSDSDSVRSRSLPATNRLSQLAQPSRRYLESTKSMFESVLRKPYLERLNKKINMVNKWDNRPTSVSSSVKCSRTPARTDLEPECDLAKSDGDRRDAEEVNDNESSTSSTSTSSTSVTSSSTTEGSVVTSVHYTSPSEEEEDTDANSDTHTETLNAAFANTIELGGIVYVGGATVNRDDREPESTCETMSLPPTPVSEVRPNPIQHSTHKDNFIKIDMDTWNIITHTCIENFQRREEEANEQVRPEEDGVYIADLIRQNVLKEPRKDTSPAIVDEYSTNSKLAVPPKLKESHGIHPELHSRNENPPLLPNMLGGGPIIQTLLNFDRRTEPTLGVAMLNDSADGQRRLPKDAEMSLDAVVLAMMDSFSEKVSQLREPVDVDSVENNPETASDTDSLASTAWSQRSGAWKRWEELCNIRGGKKYHPKRSIPDEISVCLEEKGDSKTLFDILREYLSSENESEPPDKTEMILNRRPGVVQEVTRDLCGLYEIQSDDSEGDPVVFQTERCHPHGVGLLGTLYGSVGVGSTVFMSYPVVTEGARVVEITDDVVTSDVHNASSNHTDRVCEEPDDALGDHKEVDKTRIPTSEVHFDDPYQSSWDQILGGCSILLSSNINNEEESRISCKMSPQEGTSDKVGHSVCDTDISVPDNEEKVLSSSYKVLSEEEIGNKDVEVKMIFENLIDNKDEENSQSNCNDSKCSTLSSSHEGFDVGKGEKCEWSRGCVKLETTVPCPSLACVSDVLVSNSDTPLCVTLPVMDVTTPETVRDLLCALTHTQESSCDLDTPPRSMETLLRQFSAVSLPGGWEEPVEKVVDSQDPYLETLALLPEPVYQGLYPASAMTGATVEATPSPPARDRGGRGDFVSRDVQTDEVFPWPVLSREEIQGTDDSFANSLETQDSEEVGINSQNSMNMGDADRSSISDMAIYTEVLAEYSDPVRLAELKERLTAALEANRNNSLDDDRESTCERRRDTNRVIAILSFLCFIFTFITISVLSIPHRCE